MPPTPGKPTEHTKPIKVGFYQDPEHAARMRGAALHTMAEEGHRSLSAFIDHAVMKEVRRLETKYNDGQPFPAVPAHHLPKGRPLSGH